MPRYLIRSVLTVATLTGITGGGAVWLSRYADDDEFDEEREAREDSVDGRVGTATSGGGGGGGATPSTAGATGGEAHPQTVQPAGARAGAAFQREDADESARARVRHPPQLQQIGYDTRDGGGGGGRGGIGELVDTERQRPSAITRSTSDAGSLEAARTLRRPATSAYDDAQRRTQGRERDDMAAAAGGGKRGRGGEWAGGHDASDSRAPPPPPPPGRLSPPSRDASGADATAAATPSSPLSRIAPSSASAASSSSIRRDARGGAVRLLGRSTEPRDGAPDQPPAAAAAAERDAADTRRAPRPQAPQRAPLSPHAVLFEAPGEGDNAASSVPRLRRRLTPRASVGVDGR